MIVCPACHAENPDGTKICVKCATELPKAAGAGPGKAKAAAAEAPKSKGLKDVSRDMVDLLWLAVIILIIFMAFLYEATNHTWHFADTEEAKIAQVPIHAVKPTVTHSRKGGTVSHGRSTVVEAPVPVVEEPLIPPAPGAPEAPAIPPALVPAQTELEASIERPRVPSGSAENFFQKGKTQYDTHHYQTSYNFLKQALEIDPTFAKAYFGLGYLYSRFDMDDAAVRMYEMALRFDPAHVDSINNLAMMYYHAGNSDDALDLLQKASTLESQNADVEYNLGSIYLEKDQNDAALQAFQKAASIRPKDATIYNNMALTYEKLGKRQEAEDSWQKVLEYANSSVLLQQAKAHLDFLQTKG